MDASIGAGPMGKACARDSDHQAHPALGTLHLCPMPLCRATCSPPACTCAGAQAGRRRSPPRLLDIVRRLLPRLAPPPYRAPPAPSPRALQHISPPAPSICTPPSRPPPRPLAPLPAAPPPPCAAPWPRAPCAPRAPPRAVPPPRPSFAAALSAPPHCRLHRRLLRRLLHRIRATACAFRAASFSLPRAPPPSFSLARRAPPPAAAAPARPVALRRLVGPPPRLLRLLVRKPLHLRRPSRRSRRLLIDWPIECVVALALLLALGRAAPAAACSADLLSPARLAFLASRLRALRASSSSAPSALAPCSSITLAICIGYGKMSSRGCVQ